MINEDEDDDTMKCHNTSDYRPAFLDHFERKEKGEEVAVDADPVQPSQAEAVPAPNVNPQLQKQLDQIAGKGVTSSLNTEAKESDRLEKYHKSLLAGDLNFVRLDKTANYVRVTQSFNVVVEVSAF